MKRFLKILRKTSMTIIAILLLLFVSLQTELVQNWLVGIAVKKLSSSLHTEVKVKKVSISLFNKFNVEGVLVRDIQKDTLLYVGSLKIRITDWFFLKKNVDLKYIGLEDAKIKLQRNDSIWNYQFLINYFTSSDTSQSSSKKTLGIKKVDLKNVSFIQNDYWKGEIIQASVANLTLVANNINLKKKLIELNSIEIEKPIFYLENLTPIQTKVKNSLPKNSSTVSRLQLNPDSLNIKIKDVIVHNGSFKLENNQSVANVLFDGEHVNIYKIQGRFKNILLNKDTLKSEIALSAKERSGFELRKLKADFKVTPHIMEFAKLDIETPKSKLGNYFAMKYHHFGEDFSDYVTNVVMESRMKDAKVHSDDIAFFAPPLKSWKREVIFNGEFHGTVADFHTKNLFARMGSNTYATGNFEMKGLPDINRTLIHFNNGIVQTNRKDLSVFFPKLSTLKEPNFDGLGNVLFRGNFQGVINDFETRGNLTTNYGSLSVNIAIKIPTNADATYSGIITTEKFDLGKFLEYKQLGNIAIDSKITGRSFDINRLKCSIEGNIKSLDFNGYTYSNITTNGLFQKKYFNGEVKIDDSNLSLNSQIEVDLNQQQPRFNILGDIVKSKLKALNFSRKNISLTGLLDVNFAGTNIDNFLGNAKLINAKIASDENIVSFDSLTIQSSYKDSNKYLILSSNDFRGQVVGHFNILDLPNSFQSFLNIYYPSYVAEPASVPKKQDFSFRIETGVIEPYLKFFDKKLRGLDSLLIEGNINTYTNQFLVNAHVPYAKYLNYIIKDAEINGKGNFDSLQLAGFIKDIKVTDSLSFPNTKINISSSKDHSKVSIKTEGSSSINAGDLNLDIFTLEDGFRVNINPSSFILNDKRWNLEKAGEIVVRDNFVSANDVKFTQGIQEIIVETKEADGGNTNNLEIQLKDVEIGDITSIFIKKPPFFGKTSGHIEMTDFFGEFNANADLKTTGFKMDADSVGLVDVKANYSKKKGIVDFKVLAPNKKYNLDAIGTYDLNDTSKNPLNTTLSFDNTSVDMLNEVLGDVFSDIKGLATGKLIVKGDPKSPILLGKVKLKKGGLKVNYTQVYYSIDSADIKFEEDGINFGKLIITDNYKNKGIIRGKLYEVGFKNMYYDFDLTSNKLLLIDTKPKDNQQFYGNAIGKANLSFIGPETNTKLSLVASANDLSNIFIPSSVNKETESTDFIVFKKVEKDTTKRSLKSNFNILVDLDISANEKVKIQVIMDELAGDVINATGNGRLRIKAGTKEPFTMRGRYNIDKGSYDFNFQSFIKKPFILKPEAGNYIEWNGDPLNADIHIDAQYTADNISVSDLISSQQGTFSTSSRAYRGTVYVIASLRDKLSKPTITFKLDFPQGSQIKSDATFNEFLDRLAKDENEMLKQVTYLIVFNSFAPYGEANNTNNGNSSITSIGVNTISQIFVKQVNKTISNLLYKLTKDKSLHFDVGNSVYSSANIFSSSISSSNNNVLDRNSLNFKLGYNFFHDNVIVTFGGDFDFNLSNNTTTQNGSFQWLPDLNAEIVLSKDKKLRGLIFSKNSLDINGTTLGRRNRQGFGISYKRDFNKSPFENNKPKNAARKPEENNIISDDDNVDLGK